MKTTHARNRRPAGGNQLQSRFANLAGTGRGGVLALLLALSASVAADPIVIPNGDFSDPSNSGSIGGLIGPNIINQPIGAGGLWNGNAFGVLGLLARPTLTIDSASQTATISGLLGINVAGLLNNGGSFVQELGTSYQFGRFYVLSADVDTDSLLDLTALGNANVGIALTSMGNVIASSTTTDPALIELSQLGDGAYQLRFGHVADIGSSGFIGVRLFNEPNQLLTASLISSVSFRNVQLEERDIGVPTNVNVVPGDPGNNQAPTGGPFPGTFIATVTDAEGDGVPGFAVVISSPTDGASADLSSPTSSDPPGRLIVATTDLDGVVTFDATANDIAGCYRIHIESQDPELEISQAVFYMRNFSDDPGQDSLFCNGYQQ